MTLKKSTAALLIVASTTTLAFAQKSNPKPTKTSSSSSQSSGPQLAEDSIQLLGFAMQRMPDGKERPVAAFERSGEEWVNNRNFTTRKKSEIFLLTIQQLSKRTGGVYKQALTGLKAAVANDTNKPMRRIKNEKDLAPGEILGKSEPRVPIPMFEPSPTLSLLVMGFVMQSLLLPENLSFQTTVFDQKTGKWKAKFKNPKGEELIFTEEQLIISRYADVGFLLKQLNDPKDPMYDTVEKHPDDPAP